ncbi:uncharacterized protein G2W53_044666 [Senna tora]|uniref:Uncharacterized protein n=1 Tax=Senna tora TaxID=362788 RepID=A0A834VXQ5_9FABA|nr:uncharacterized protein G2W53_044666 [Senna tora]
MAVRNSFDGQSAVKSVSDRIRPSEKVLTDLRSVQKLTKCLTAYLHQKPSVF